MRLCIQLSTSVGDEALSTKSSATRQNAYLDDHVIRQLILSLSDDCNSQKSQVDASPTMEDSAREIETSTFQSESFKSLLEAQDTVGVVA